jgi:protein-tyrosine kinase
MEHIRKAIERAGGLQSSNSRQQSGTSWLREQIQQSAGRLPAGQPAPRNEVVLNPTYLESRRLLSHDITDPRSRSFDMLRTQVLQTMDASAWQLVGVTSPTAACGKTVTAANLALSIARQPERSVLLVDLDLLRPQVAIQLGFKCNKGVLSVVNGKTNLAEALISARIQNCRFFVLPCERAVPNSSEWMASRSMSAFLRQLRQDFKGWTIIIDLPPILLSDDVISILPQIDCALFVIAAGLSTAPEIKECHKHLGSTPIVRVVLNKATDASPVNYYYSYSRYAQPPAPQARKGKRDRSSATSD